MRRARTRGGGRRVGLAGGRGWRRRGSRGVAHGRALMQGSVRAMGVVVLRVLAQYDVEVASSGDQDVVEAFSTQGADEAFCDRVRPRRPDRAANDADVGAIARPSIRGPEVGRAPMRPATCGWCRATRM